MKKDWKKIGVILIVLLSFKIAYASGGQVFGGKITEAPDTQVKTLDEGDYNCEPQNTTIDINPFKGPQKFYIPQGTESKSHNKEKVGQWVIGLYSGTTTITCTMKQYPFSVQTFQFNTIKKIWGNSK
ncbi:MAG: hypothetical protein NT068_00340 [Candidatus Nomurabacteria bacterium]|nr:hypothetical protein [Candidatus Nomurabacteria bacterium]